MKNSIKLVSLFVLACMLGVGIAAMLPATASADDDPGDPCIEVLYPFWYCPYMEGPCKTQPLVWKRFICEGYTQYTEEPCDCINYGCATGCYEM